MKRVVLAAVLVAGLAAPAVAQMAAAPKADDIIAARQAGMALTGGLMDAMKAGIAAGVDVKPFAEGAGAIAKYGAAYPGLFPDGTQSGHDTKAKAEIWSDKAGFDKDSQAMVVAAQKLEEAAKSGDKQQFAQAFQAVGQTCGACHRAYKNR